MKKRHAKDEEIKVRVPAAMKAQVMALAAERDEGSASTVVREALKEYLAKRKARPGVASAVSSPADEVIEGLRAEVPTDGGEPHGSRPTHERSDVSHPRSKKRT